ncbi:olfactory receptor 5V1-like [Talpa occidentalis]|uniref:olfactory receptor 5V1-like n=1 Tax=Talpa occidentalis TaxID=50954 RepID=UPI00188F3A9E|nr:olfactory receptor 5V1-like [Talpa occidentalis]
MAADRGRNASTIAYVVLLGFGDLGDAGKALFSLFLGLYLVTVLGNLLLILAVHSSPRLHTPMYLLLCHLSCVDVGYTSSIAPQLLQEVLAGSLTVPFAACVAQLYVVGALLTTECFLLAAMSYDRYLAICRPLRYAVLMDSTACLSCTDTAAVERVALASSFLSLSPFLWTLLSYSCILTSILRLSSSAGRRKAFSTCSSHLIVVSVFYGTLIARLAGVTSL